MELQIVSFELAKKLKEIGFDNNEQRFYNKDGKLLDWVSDYFNNEELDNDQCIAPTQALAQMWFREKHGIDIVVYPALNSKKTHIGYGFGIVNLNTGEETSDYIIHNNIYKPDVTEIALLKAYEIVKEKG